MQKEWRCFHCDEVFTDESSAEEHFGRHQGHDPACTIDIKRFREMEKFHEANVAEDTAMYRALYAKDAEMSRAVIRAEEEGYAKGLRDGRRQVDTLFDAIKHGDEAHQLWLKDAIDKHFNA